MRSRTDDIPASPAGRIVDPSGGSNQTRVRAYNERLVMALVRRHGSLPRAEIARRSGLSAQTVSVIMRSLERDTLLVRGEPVRGRVGQPSVPMALNPDAVFSVGLKIGRRSADLILMDFVGTVRKQLRKTFAFPLPADILDFAKEGLTVLLNELGGPARERVAGIGIAMPFELWNWLEQVGASSTEMNAWREFDFAETMAEFTDLPVFVQNDATAACGAELVFGRGKEFADFAYFFLGSFIGGGLVLNHAVYPGRNENAAAFGAIQVPGPDGKTRQLLNQASIFVLEGRLKKAGIDPSPLWMRPSEWPDFGSHLDQWIEESALNIAIAIATIGAIIDIDAFMIDGGFPGDVRRRLVTAIEVALGNLDLQGIRKPCVFEAEIGHEARAVGGASLPMFDRFMINQNVLVKEPG